jgi:hypothetical protein
MFLVTAKYTDTGTNNEYSRFLFAEGSIMSGIRRVSDLGSKGVSSILDGSIQAADLSPTISLSGFRNLIINGDFRINQRGYTSGTSLSSGVYGFDRWKVITGPLALTFTTSPQGQQITIPSLGGIRQIIERANIIPGTYILSWTGTAGGRVYNEGASAPSYVTGNSLTVVLDGAANVVVDMAAGGSSATVGNVQLERSTQSTPFEQRPIGVELALCQRYLMKWSVLANSGRIAHGIASTSILMNFGLPYKVQPRTHLGTLTVEGALTISDTTATFGPTSYSRFDAVCNDVFYHLQVATTGVTQFRTYYLEGAGVPTANIRSDMEL